MKMEMTLQSNQTSLEGGDVDVAGAGQVVGVVAEEASSVMNKSQALLKNILQQTKHHCSCKDRATNPTEKPNLT